MRGALSIVRATGIAWGYAVTLGCLLVARQSWVDPRIHSGAFASWFETTAKTIWFISPYIVLIASLFALIATPLAAWAVGLASWNSSKRYIYAFWSVLALFIVASRNPDGLILISGAGLIALWFLMNRKNLRLARIRSKNSARIQMSLRTADSKRNITVFAVLIVITSIFPISLFFRNGTKVYVSEMFAIYTGASVCQGLKTFMVIACRQNESPERTP